MPLAMGMVKWTPEAMKHLIDEGPLARVEYFRKWAKEMGGALRDYYFAEASDFDALAIVEFPAEMRADPARCMAAWAANWSSGYAESLRMVWLATPEAFAEALKGRITVVPPGSE